MTLLIEIIALFLIIFAAGLCAGITKNREMKNKELKQEDVFPGVALTRRVPDPFEGFNGNKRKDKG